MGTAWDIALVGGGVIGLNTAYFLARDGARVAVLDKGDLGQEASWAGAGILPPGNLDEARSPFDKLRSISSSLFPQLSAELRERTGSDNGYLRCGGLEVWSPEEVADPEEWRGAGVRVELVEGSALRRLEPALAPTIERAYHLPDLAQVRNPWHLRALAAACTALGVTLLPHQEVKAFDKQGARVTTVRTSSDVYPVGQILVAAGAWSDPLLGQLGWRPGIEPVRGQIALLQAKAPLLGRVLMCGPRYLVPRSDGRLLVGSTEEHVGFEKRTTAGAIAGLLHLACSLVPDLASATLERSWSGLRPGSPDGLPFLGRVPGWDNAFVAAGHFRAGLQLSPGTALLMKQLMLGQSPALDLTPFRLDR